MLLRYLPMIAGLLPIIAIHLSLLLAIGAGTIPACFPYIEGCASISATGRYVPASFLFKPAMTAEAVIMVAYWLFNVAWLRSLHRVADLPDKIGGVTATLGTVGALFLMVYVTFLGTQEPIYEFMRRFGVYLYFALTIFAQITLVVRLMQVNKILALVSIRNIARLQLGLALVPFVLGVLNLVLKATLDDPDPSENIIEWIFALLMHCYFVLTYFAWRETGFCMGFSVRTR